MSKKKLNNKGFAVSAMLYTLLTAFLLFLGASLAQFSSSAKILSSANNDLTDGFAYNISVYYEVGGGQLTSRSYKLINGKNGQFLIDGNVFKKFGELRKDPWTLFATTNFSYVNRYSYPVVGMPYVPLDNDFVVNTAGLTKKGFRFIGWENPTLRWLYIEKDANGNEITSGVKNGYGKTINYANLLNYASGREDKDNIPKPKIGNVDVTVNALQIIYKAKWDVDVFVYYLYKDSCDGVVDRGFDKGHVPYRYKKENYSLYGNINDVKKIKYQIINGAKGEKKMYYYDYSNGIQDVSSARNISSISEPTLEDFIKEKDKATGIVIVIDKRSTGGCS